MISKLRAYRKPFKGFARAKRIVVFWQKRPDFTKTKTPRQKYKYIGVSVYVPPK